MLGWARAGRGPVGERVAELGRLRAERPTLKEVKVADGVFRSWKGLVNSKYISQPEGELQDVAINSSFTENQLNLQVSAKSGKLYTNSEYMRWIKPVFLDHEFTDEGIIMRNVQLDFIANQAEKKWKNLASPYDDTYLTYIFVGACYFGLLMADSADLS